MASAKAGLMGDSAMTAEDLGKAVKRWNERSDEIEELKKIFF
jgi:hypothetical protein